HVVDVLVRGYEAAAAELRVGVLVGVDQPAALRELPDVGGGAAMDLMEGALAEDRDHPDLGRVRHPLEEVEVDEPSARCVEALIHSARLLEQLPRDEDAVALPLVVEPVAAPDEVADVEELVAVGRPRDLVEEPILVLLAIP